MMRKGEPALLEIKVFGPGCARCEALMRKTVNVLAELDIAADVEKVSDLDRMAQMGVMVTPALAINGRLKCSGRVPSEAEIAEWINAEAST
jgi:small redox-active disulfide protein 2